MTRAPAPVRLVDFDDEPVGIHGNRWDEEKWKPVFRPHPACLMTFRAAEVKKEPLGEGCRPLVSGEGWIGIPLAAI
jgi:hypothetical protein